MCIVSLISDSSLQTLFGYDSCVVFLVAQVFLNAVSITTGCGMALFRMFCIRESNQCKVLEKNKVQCLMKKILCGEFVIILTIVILGLFQPYFAHYII